MPDSVLSPSMGPRQRLTLSLGATRIFQGPPSADKAIHEHAIVGHRCQWASGQQLDCQVEHRLPRTFGYLSVYWTGTSACVRDQQASPQPDGHTSNCQSEVVFAHEIPLPTDGALRPVRARGNGLGISFTDEYLNPGFSNAGHRRSGACPGRRQPLVDPGQYGWQAAWAVACP